MSAPRLWLARQGASTAKIRAVDFCAARERAAQIGFSRPDSIVLQDETPRRGITTKFLFTDGDYFVAMTNTGCVRIGLAGCTCYDIPPGHAWFDRVREADTRATIEDLHDELISAYDGRSVIDGEPT